MTQIITIDGPSGSGKGTLAAKLAAHYGFALLDSGAIYRLLGLKLHRAQRLPQCHTQLEPCIRLAQTLDIEFLPDNRVLLEGEDVSQIIRSETVGSYASEIAVIPELRAALLQRQRDFAQGEGLVADGRDMGTLVFPQAQVKLYLTASAESRAQRRVKQLRELGQDVSISGILSDIQARDDRDMNRTIAPLRPAADAKVIDSSALSIAQVFAQMIEYIDAVLGHPRCI